MSAWAVPGYSESCELGSGAGGRVVSAVHDRTGVPVAVKYLGESLRTRPDFVRGFRTEAELLGGLHSPYVAGLYEYVEAAEGAAIVMELVDGVSLRTVLVREGALSPETALVVLKGSLLGLADAHRVGVVHRDYKPENVLVSPEGLSKLVDFGIAVETGLRAGVSGTPAYMAPEQWTGAPASPATDVYAATATFVECLTGHKPFSGGNLAELALQHVRGAVPVEDVPEAVRPLVRRGLAKSAADRPRDAASFVADLEAVAVASYGGDWEERGRGRLAAVVALLLFLLPSAREAPRSTADTARTVLGGDASRGRLRPWRPTWPGVAVSAAAALLAVLLAEDIGQGGVVGAGPAARAVATTSATPDAGGGPGAGSVPSSPAPSPPSSAGTAPPASAGPSSDAPGPSPEPAVSSASPSPAAPGTGTTTGAPTTPGSPTATTGTSAPPSSPAPPAVEDIAVSDFRQTGPTTATATITVSTDGPGPVSVTVGWFTADTGGQPGAADGQTTTVRRDGAMRYTLTVDHVFQGTGCYWTVRATSSPASADGGATQQLPTRQCEIR
ncbi:serine/threonine-protein kinase [Streptomyces sp. NPDC003247]|uniref:serine/threonine-protein kinase n=1 Tax=Streptomyces sp. NPDC003247 TaxID=3364677 RepID=UPI00367E08DB